MGAPVGTEPSGDAVHDLGTPSSRPRGSRGFPARLIQKPDTTVGRMALFHDLDSEVQELFLPLRALLVLPLSCAQPADPVAAHPVVDMVGDEPEATRALIPAMIMMTARATVRRMMRIDSGRDSRNSDAVLRASAKHVASHTSTPTIVAAKPARSLALKITLSTGIHPPHRASGPVTPLLKQPAPARAPALSACGRTPTCSAGPRQRARAPRTICRIHQG